MKLTYQLVLSIILTFVGVHVYAQQQTGELDRFKNESLTVKNEITLFPNPSVDYLEVKINYSTLEQASFTVHNIIGNEVDVSIRQTKENTFQINVEDLAPGYYLIAIKDDQSAFKETYKFIKR